MQDGMLTTKQVAEALGVNYSSLRVWLNGKIKVAPTKTETKEFSVNLYSPGAVKAIQAALKKKNEDKLAARERRKAERRPKRLS